MIFGNEKEPHSHTSGFPIYSSEKPFIVSKVIDSNFVPIKKDWKIVSINMNIY